jgi:hypothetical protein
VSGLGEAVASFFVAAPGERPARARLEAPARADRAVAVIAAPGEAGAAGAAAGLGLVRAQRVPCALVMAWGARVPAGWAAPAPAAGRRLVQALEARGITARTAGRLVQVALPPGEDDALRCARRAAAAATGLPVVLVVGAPRGAAADAEIAGCDRVLLVGRAEADAAVVELAAARLDHHDASTCLVTSTPAGRAAALAGLWVAPCLRPVAEAAGGRS